MGSVELSYTPYKVLHVPKFRSVVGFLAMCAQNVAYWNCRTGMDVVHRNADMPLVRCELSPHRAVRFYLSAFLCEGPSALLQLIPFVLSLSNVRVV